MCLWETINEQNPSKPDGRPLSGRPVRRARPYGEFNEPMMEASERQFPRQIESGRGSRKTGGELFAAIRAANGGMRDSRTSAHGCICDGRAPDTTRGRVGSCSGRRSVTGTWEPCRGFPGPNGRGMTKATGERHGKGRSLRSSLRAGKPSTWRREAVDAAGKQEADTCPTR